MSQDISHILVGWEFDPHELNVRIVMGDDGNEKIQMRIDLGLLQMAIAGRPDGKAPDGYESLLEFYENEARGYGEGYRLTNEAVDDLFREGWQYYQRYLSLFHLGHYSLVVRDTERNLRLFQFVRKHARRKRDQWRFDQYRPYVIMMNTRACAMMSLEAGDRQDALARIALGREQIETFLVEYNRPVDDNECFELEFLKRWQEELQTPSPKTPRGSEPAAPTSTPPTESSDMSLLRTRLQNAIDREDYENAAILRDQIKQLEQSEPKNTP